MTYRNWIPGFAAVVAGLGGAPVNGQPPASDASRSSARLLFTARFASTCEPSDAPPNFQFDVYDDGRVRYLGGDLVREKGEREYRIAGRQAARLAARIRSALSKSDFDRHHPPALPLNWGDNGKILEGRCLLLTAYEDGVSTEGTILLESQVGDALDDLLNSTLDVEALICPERTGGRLSKQCDNRSFGFELALARETCGWFHAVNFYRDGVVHYFVEGLAESDRYFELDPAAINNLAEEAAALSDDTVVVPRSSRPPNPQYPREFLLSFTDADATRAIADRIAALLSLEWQETPLTSDPTRCGGGPFAGPFPRGSTVLPPSLLSGQTPR